MSVRRLSRPALGLLPSRLRLKIESRARDLIAEHGDEAYYVARELARGGRPYGTRKDPFWSKVASRIAKHTAREIGLTTADRLLNHGKIHA